MNRQTTNNTKTPSTITADVIHLSSQQSQSVEQPQPQLSVSQLHDKLLSDIKIPSDYFKKRLMNVCGIIPITINRGFATDDFFVFYGFICNRVVS